MLFRPLELTVFTLSTWEIEGSPSLIKHAFTQSCSEMLYTFNSLEFPLLAQFHAFDLLGQPVQQ
jgi:hypothetical protein